mgnify:CR=1 FL=1
MIYRSPFPDVDIATMSLLVFVLEHADRRSGKAALIDGPTGHTLTYAQLAGAIKRTATGLAARGFTKGDVLGRPGAKARSMPCGWDYENTHKDPLEQGILVKDFLLKYRNYKVDIFVYTENKSGKPLIRSGFSVVSISLSVIVERKDNGGTTEKENIAISEKEIANLNKGNPWD